MFTSIYFGSHFKVEGQLVSPESGATCENALTVVLRPEVWK